MTTSSSSRSVFTPNISEQRTSAIAVGDGDADGNKNTTNPIIELLLASPSDLPALVDLQFQCFSHSVMVEQIVHPDTPNNRREVVDKHLQHMRHDRGLKVVKAVIRRRRHGDYRVSQDETVNHPSWQTGEHDGQIQDREETIVGFCMFYVPYREGSMTMLPTPLRFHTPMPSSPSDHRTKNSGAEAGREKQAGAGAGTDIITEVKPETEPDLLPVPTTLTTTSIDHTANTTMVMTDINNTNISTFRAHREGVLNGVMDSRHGAGYVRYMCVHPGYRRYGIGRKLMEWGCYEIFDRAQRPADNGDDTGMGVDAYLEATVEGERLYRLFGFEKVGEQMLEVGGVVKARYPCMWRKRGG